GSNWRYMSSEAEASPGRPTAFASRLLDCRSFSTGEMSFTVVKPDTLIRWHRQGFRLFWKWKSRAAGRPRVPVDLQRLVAAMAMSNPTWGEERISNELRRDSDTQWTASRIQAGAHGSLKPAL